VLEGPDGAGKSLQAARLAASLQARGFDVTLTREPGGTHLGEAIRAILLDPGPTPRGPEADALLFSAARAQHVREVIEPAIARGSSVICDRYSTSTLAYQGYGSGLAIAELRGMQRFATRGLEPDLVVLLDIPVAVGLASRGTGDPSQVTRFEDESRHDVAFHERVRAGYLDMAARDPGRWRIVEAARDADAVARAVLDAVITAFAWGRDASTGGSAGSTAPA
jgi:dTMP kinase